MTLPASGPISLAQIADEFGVARTAAFPSEFYGKGGAPASGPLSFADFYGRSAPPAVTFTPDGGEIDGFGSAPGSASGGASCSSSAVWTYTISSTGGGSLTSSLASGGSGTAISFTYTATGRVGGTRRISLVGTALGVTRNFEIYLELEVFG